MSIQQLRNLTTLCYIEQDGKYLMLHRVKKENDINKDKWIGVGGHFEADESPEDCVLREVKEETGYTLTAYQMCIRDSIFGVKLSTREEVVPYGRKLQEMGAQNVLISMAGEGAVLIAADGQSMGAPAPKGTPVSYTHLDVYKRQVPDRKDQCDRGASGFEPGSGGTDHGTSSCSESPGGQDHLGCRSSVLYPQNINGPQGRFRCLTPVPWHEWVPQEKRK